MAEFHERLIEQRKIKKMTQKNLSEFLGVNIRTVQYYESGEKRPEIDGIIQLAKYFNVTTDYLLGLSDDSAPPDRQNNADTPAIPPEELAFFAWVQEHVTGMHFYDFKKAMENQEWLKGLRVIYEKEKDRKPGQKQGE